MADAILSPIRPAFRAIAQTLVPESKALTETQWASLEATIEAQLAARPERLRRQLSLLIRAIDALPLLLTACRFQSMDAERRYRFLDRLQHAPLLLLRRGIWGLRTLVFMGYYTLPEVVTDIGYRADPRGWEARR